jgi:hypothetical protein
LAAGSAAAVVDDVTQYAGVAAVQWAITPAYWVFSHRRIAMQRHRSPPISFG